jgi:hypothetical protein
MGACMGQVDGGIVGRQFVAQRRCQRFVQFSQGRAHEALRPPALVPEQAQAEPVGKAGFGQSGQQSVVQFRVMQRRQDQQILRHRLAQRAQCLFFARVHVRSPLNLHGLSPGLIRPWPCCGE